MTEGFISDNVLKALQDAVETKTIDIDGVQYTTRPVHDVRKEDPTPKMLTIHTLSGLCDYLKENVDSLFIDGMSDNPEANVFVQILSHAEVAVLSPVFGHFRQRTVRIIAKFEDLFGKGFQFGQFYENEYFIICLQSLLVQSDARDDLLALVGNIKEETVGTYGDDGITQTVTGRQGAVLVATMRAPNALSLRPYRTFREIEQPESRFIFRLKAGKDGQKPTCALFESDGGAWKLTAIESIRKYISEKVPNVAIIG